MMVALISPVIIKRVIRCLVLPAHQPLVWLRKFHTDLFTLRGQLKAHHPQHRNALSCNPIREEDDHNAEEERADKE